MVTTIMKSEILQLLKEIKTVQKNNDPSVTLPNNCYYLKNSNILVIPSEYGLSRYPYSSDGLTLWAYSTGIISINEANFFVFPQCLDGKEPYASFYCGVKNKKNKYDVYSLTGSADTELGREQNVYVVYNSSYFYFIREIDKVVFAIRGTVNDKKEIVLSSTAINLSKKEKEVFISCYLNPLLTHSAYENEETKWFRTCKLTNIGAEFLSVEDVSRSVHLNNYMFLQRNSNASKIEVTSSRQDYVGNRHYSISQSRCLKEGSFERNKPLSTFIDMAAYGDINKKALQNKEELTVQYVLKIAYNEEEFNKIKNNKYTTEDINNVFKKQKQKNISIHFGKLNDLDVNNELLNSFISSVTDQVDYCSKAKNSSLMLLGIRDAYQMMEASLLWDSKTVRKKIVESLSYLDISGRAPRQYAAPSEGSDPLFDNRSFIDQGQWIISTIHKYLAFTNDYSILKEKCGYYELVGIRQGNKLDKSDTVYDHLVKIMGFLVSNLDENTYLLHTLYGDWNDAVDGLGTTSDQTKLFGNGVSIMASEHLYKNLHEMHKINQRLGKEDNYLEVASKILEGFKKHAVVSQNGTTKILHGWGENKSFTVGGFKDADGKSRYSLTSYSFYAISELYKAYPNLKDACLNAYKNLDSKYGFKTFDEYFEKSNAYMVGRIVNLPKGTAENAATYIHAAMFGVRSLLLMNEGKKAFNQLYKLLPITHNQISTSPFVMPNSYGFNPELGIDGESMNDWYTGSSNTLLKALYFDLFGLNPHLDNTIEINPLDYYPSDEIDLSLVIKGKKISISYRNSHSKQRTITVNGDVLKGNLIDLTKYKKLEIKITD